MSNLPSSNNQLVWHTLIHKTQLIHDSLLQLQANVDHQQQLFLKQQQRTNQTINNEAINIENYISSKDSIKQCNSENIAEDPNYQLEQRTKQQKDEGNDKSNDSQQKKEVLQQINLNVPMSNVENNKSTEAVVQTEVKQDVKDQGESVLLESFNSQINFDRNPKINKDFKASEIQSGQNIEQKSISDQQGESKLFSCQLSEVHLHQDISHVMDSTAHFIISIPLNNQENQQIGNNKLNLQTQTNRSILNSPLKVQQVFQTSPQNKFISEKKLSASPYQQIYQNKQIECKKVCTSGYTQPLMMHKTDQKPRNNRQQHMEQGINQIRSCDRIPNIQNKLKSNSSSSKKITFSSNLNSNIKKNFIKISPSFSSQLKDQNKHITPFSWSIYNNNLQFNIDMRNRFQLGKFLGRGKFSDVYQAQDKILRICVALKIINQNTIRTYDIYQSIAQEIHIQQSLDHPNLLKLYGYIFDGNKFVLILEYAEEGQLMKKIQKSKNKHLSEQETANYIGQIIQGIKYLHDCQILHRDLKPENILLSYGQIKIADFGISIYTGNQKRESFCGTQEYMSPEIFQNLKYDYSVDIWAIGMLTFELLVGKTPYSKRDLDNYGQNFNWISSLSELLNGCTFYAQVFIQKILVQDFNNRLTLEQMLEDEFIKNNKSNFQQIIQSNKIICKLQTLL